MNAILPPPIPVDENHGLGGSYILENGVRRLVHRTRELGEAEPASIQPASPSLPSHTQE